MASNGPDPPPASSSARPIHFLEFPGEISREVIANILDVQPIEPEPILDVNGNPIDPIIIDAINIDPYDDTDDPPGVPITQYGRFQLPAAIMGIYLACKQMKDDVDEIFFQHLTLRIPSIEVFYGLDFSVRFHERGLALSQIRRLSVDPYALREYNDWGWVLEELPELQSVVIETYYLNFERIKVYGVDDVHELIEHGSDFLKSRGVDERFLSVLPLREPLFTDAHDPVRGDGFHTLDRIACWHLSHEDYFTLCVQLHMRYGMYFNALTDETRQLSPPSLRFPSVLRRLVAASPHANRNVKICVKFKVVRCVDVGQNAVRHDPVWVSDPVSSPI